MKKQIIWRYFKKTLTLSIMALFVNNAQAGYKHHYGYGHHHYRPYYTPYYSHHYGHHYDYHHKYRRHYGVHGHLSGDAAYIVLGVLGAAILAHIFTSSSKRSKTVSKSYPYQRPSAQPYISNNKKITHYKKQKRTYHYKHNEGWDWLSKGNSDYALDIFAIQSQQNLSSGIPRIGFSLAAANMGQYDRATRAMRKAIRIDPDALDEIVLNNTLANEISALPEKRVLNDSNTEHAFLLATHAYLLGDYKEADELLKNNDVQISTNNLRNLIKQTIKQG